MTDTPLLIAQADPPHLTRGGDWYYRTFLPGRALAALPGIHVVDFDNGHRYRETLFEKADVLVLNSVCDADLLPVLVERRKRRLLTVYELNDDVSAIQPWNPVHHFFKHPENVRLFARLARSSDANQYSVEELRRIYGHLHTRSVVFENQLADAVPARPLAERPLTIGWGGSHGHLADMATLAAPLIAWLETRPDVELHLMCSPPIWALFDRLPETRKRHTPPGSIDDYYAFLREIDIGLAPLLDTAFNRCRSDVKFLEYAAHGVVPVLQDLVPYQGTGEAALRFRDGAKLIQILDRLHADRVLVRTVARCARDQVLSGRLQGQHSGERLDFYRSGLAALGHHSGGDRAREFAAIAGWEGAEVTGRHAILGPTRFEALIHDGLVLGQQRNRPTDAIERFREASELEPGNALPHLGWATATPNDAAPLEEALQRKPASIQALLALGSLRVRNANVPGALDCFQQAAALFPSYEVPYLRTAALLRRIGQTGEAEELERQATELTRPLFKNG